MNADEITRALRWLAKERESLFAAENLNRAADLMNTTHLTMRACGGEWGFVGQTHIINVG